MPTDMDDRPDVSAALAGSWIGAAIGPEARARLVPIARTSRVPDGATILTEGGPVTALGIVIQGRVALRLRVPERGAITVSTVEPGDVIGWSAVVPPHRSTSTAVAIGPTELVLIDGPALRRDLAADHDLAAEIYPVLLTAVARRLVGTRLQLLDLFAGDVAPW